MNRNPYKVTGPCQRCNWAAATSRCQYRREPELMLCARCANAWWDEVDAKLAERGVRPV